MGNREITIADVLSIALKHIKIIVAVMLVGAILGFCYCSYMVDPVYQSKSKFFVDTGSLTENSNNNNKLVEQHNVTVFSRQVVTSYIGILDTLNFAETLSGRAAKAGELSRDYSARALLGSIDYNFEEDLEIFTVRVVADTPDDAYIIASCIEDIAEEYLVTKKPTAAGTLKIIDDARVEASPVNINMSITVMLGAILGAALAFAVCFIVEINDVRVKSEKEISEILDIPVIGSIPEYVTSVQEKASSKKKTN